MNAPLSRGLIAIAALAAAAAFSGSASAATPPKVLVAEFVNDVNPVTQEYLLDAIQRGEDEGFEAVVIEMDTPGGLGSSMRAIVKGILAAKIPVIVYVAPPGASADSAGAVIGMAADVLAMAPQTNIGSSTPISIGGEDISKDLRRKVVNDAAAYIGELAREHDRNVDVARRMVTVATNLGAREALEKNVIDVLAKDYPDLFRQIDGMTTKPKGLTISTPPETTIVRTEMSAWKRLLDLLIDPNIIALMLSIGLIGIVVELWNPGLIFPGTVGAISLIVGLYGLQVLPVSIAGLLLMLLAAGFFVAEAFIVSHGALALAGAITFVIGALMLFDPAGEAYQVSLPVALAISGTLALLFGFALTKAAQARRMPAAVGAHRLVGEPGEVREGLVFVDGELWHAKSSDGSPLEPGERVVVEAVDPESLHLVVGSAARPPLPSLPKGPDVSVALIAIAAIVLLILLFAFAAIKVAREYERGVIFRLGRLLPEPKGPGLFLLIPIIDRMVKVDLRTITLNVPPQEVITKDNVPVRVNAVAYFRIIEPKNAIVQIENFMVATSQISQTTLRSVLGQHSLDELLSERDKINAILQSIIDEATSPWGVKVSIVEVKDVEIPAGMQRAMARQAEAERERRAKIIAAEGEFQASQKLADAADVMSKAPMALQLRYLQTLLEIGATNATTIVFPAPIDMLTAFMGKATGSGGTIEGGPPAS